MVQQKRKGKEITVSFPDSLKGGVYANSMQVSHTREEFIMDFLLIAAPAGAVTARIIINPSHMKRIITALQQAMKNYENKHGPIEAAKEPGTFGFRLSKTGKA